MGTGMCAGSFMVGHEWGGPWGSYAVGLMCEDEPPGSGLEKPEVCLRTIGRSPE